MILLVITVLLLVAGEATASRILFQKDSTRRRLAQDKISIEPDNVFWTTLKTPQGTFSVILDTGSTRTIVPCGSCLNRCGRQHKQYVVSITENTPNNGYFEQCYQEGGCIKGMMLTDIPACLGDFCRTQSIGCASSYPPLFKQQEADGIIGLGSFLSVASSYSLLFGDEEGILFINEPHPSEGVTWYPLKEQGGGLPYFQMNNHSILLDTGTSYSRLPPNTPFPQLKETFTRGPYVLGVDGLIGLEVIIDKRFGLIGFV